jgi:S1-C subfamily serine protease
VATGSSQSFVGSKGAVFGHPGGQNPLRIAPAFVRQDVLALGRDLYDSHDTKRDVFILAANLMPGDSGGALVDAGGAVVGVAFAIAPDRPGTSYALSAKEIRTILPLAGGGRVRTGPCLNEG